MCSLLDRPGCRRRSHPPLTPADSLYGSWTWLTLGPTGVTMTSTKATSSPWQLPSTCSLRWIPGAPISHDVLAHFPNHSPQWHGSSLDTSHTTSRSSTQRGQSSKLPAPSSHMLETVGFEHATPTPAAWIEMFRHRFSFWEE